VRGKTTEQTEINGTYGKAGGAAEEIVDIFSRLLAKEAGLFHNQFRMFR